MIGGLSIFSIIYLGMMPVVATQKPTTRSINHYEIDIPAGYAIRSTAPARTDFALYEIARVDEKSAVLVLYFGNNPSFPKLKWSIPAQVEVRNGRTAKEYPYSKESRQLEGLIVFDGLTYKKSQGSPFTCIHYFSRGVRQKEVRDFATIIRSIRVAKPHLE